MYSFPFLINNLGTVVQLVLVVILFFAEKPCVDDSRGQMILDKYYLFMLFCVFALVVSMVANINYGFNGRKLLSIIFILLILYNVKSSKIDIPFFLSVYLNVALVCSIYAIIQATSAFLFQVYLPKNILPLETTMDVYNGLLERSHYVVYRSSSLFSEPAAFAQYIIPALCLRLSTTQTRENQFATIIMLVGIIVSTSSLGILTALIVWVITSYRRTGKNIIKYIGSAIFLIVVGIIVLNVSSYISDSMGEIFGGGVNGKTNDRVFRGLSIFAQIPNEFKLFGIGLGNAERVIKENAITTIYDSTWYVTYEYFNNIASALIYGGVFGCFAFVMSFAVFLKENDSVSKMIAFVFLVMSCASSMFFNTMFLFYGVCLIATMRCVGGTLRNSYA